MSLVLIGLPASGKTTVGQALAMRLDLPLRDSDAMVEQRDGRTVQQIFAEDGEAGFRQREQQAALEALAEPGVVSLGGGAITNPVIRDHLAGHQVVWLDVSVPTLSRRVGLNRLRPLLLGDVRGQLEVLAAERRDFYLQAATYRVDAEAPVDIVVAQIADYLRGVRTVRVTADHPYDVRIGRGLTRQAGDLLAGVNRTAILHPPVLAGPAARLAEAVPGALLIELPDGEAGKTVAVLERVWRSLAGAGLTRSDAIIGLGGGATTDLAGFVAATFLRGVAYLNLPTTVLGMTDAGLGGKTGIDLPEGKNLVGAFHQPLAVLCDLDLLVGLPSDQVRSGLGELVKHGFIADPAILDTAARQPAELAQTLSETFADSLFRAVSVKAAAVSADVWERGGGPGIGREALNYGHTLAHAIEQAEGFRWAHGYAVSVGMVFAAEVACRLDLLSPADVRLHRQILTGLGLPVSYAGAPWEVVRPVMSRDKKARGTRLRLVLLDGIGHPVVVPEVDEAILRRAYQAIGGAVAG